MRWLDSDDWALGENSALRQPIAVLAPALLDRCCEQVVKRCKHFAHQSAAKRHRLRIALKKLRYAAELFSGLYVPEATRPFTQRLKRLQDDLGAANDVRVARDIVTSLAPSNRRSTGIAHAGQRVIAWHKHRIDKNETGLRRHLAELLAAEWFWRGENA
jgi:triphosphatase